METNQPVMVIKKPKTFMEYALLEVPIPGTTWVIPFAVGGMIVGGIIWVVAYNLQKSGENNA